MTNIRKDSNMKLTVGLVETIILQLSEVCIMYIIKDFAPCMNS